MTRTSPVKRGKWVLDNILGVHERVAALYFEDGSIEGACPPLKALLHIMKDGPYEGKTLADAEIRDLFCRKKMMASDWYQARLKQRQDVEVKLWERHETYLNEAIAKLTDGKYSDETQELNARLQHAIETLGVFRADGRVKQLEGTLGTDPYLYQ